MDLLAAAEAEVVARHEFFVRWFTGRAAEADMTRTTGLFSPDFRMISPDGRETDGSAVIDYLQNRKATCAPDFTIRIDIRDTRMIGTLSALVLYDEHQSGGDKPTSRRASAIFSARPDTSEGVVWRHLHETWLD